MPLALHPSLRVLLLAAAAVLALLAASPATGVAEASACKRWGDTNPGKLKPPQARKAVLCLVNRKRRGHDLRRLDRDKRLQRAAGKHSKYMDGTGCFSHQCPREKSLTGRLQAVDYITGALSRWAVGENIAWGLKDRGTPKRIVDSWMGSAPHRAAILSRTFRDAGVGFAEGTPYSRRAHGGLYTIDFGLRVG